MRFKRFIEENNNSIELQKYYNEKIKKVKNILKDFEIDTIKNNPIFTGRYVTSFDKDVQLLNKRTSNSKNLDKEEFKKIKEYAENLKKIF